MIELVALFLIIVVSVIVIRVGAIALEQTGLSRESSVFQAQSAFMGVGFTTTEAEHVVNHPVRRRIIRTLMMLGFVAVTSALGTVVVTFAAEGGDLGRPAKAGIALAGIGLVWWATRLKAVERLINLTIERALEKTTHLGVIDYRGLLNLDKGYTVAVLTIDEGSWLAGQTLRECGLADEGILVLNLTRASGLVIATPASRTEIHPGDEVLTYGLEEDIARIRGRRAGEEGDRAHRKAVERQRLRLAEERVEDAIAESEELEEKEREQSGVTD